MITVQDVEQVIGAPFATTAQHCHEVSLAIVKSGVIPQFTRVARGVCTKVTGQHSWVVVGRDCYAPNAQIIDPTLWSNDPTVTGIWIGRTNRRHTPHGGHGSIWTYGRPARSPNRPVVQLTPRTSLSRDAQLFLQLLGPLDVTGWATLASCPVQGWPAAEIIAAMDDTKTLSALVPIDRLGMLTDRNPSGLYLAGDACV